MCATTLKPAVLNKIVKDGSEINNQNVYFQNIGRGGKVKVSP